jgi:hypothetical protein
VVSALDCNNLIVVAKILHDRFPLREIIIAADNDTETAEKLGYNPGLKAAMKAARDGGCYAKLAVPPPGDFWDLWHAEGDAAVKKLIDEAVEPEAEPEAEALPPDDEEVTAAAAADVAVTKLNETYALVIVGDKVAIMKKSGDGISFMNVTAFETWFGNRYVRTRSGTRKPLGKFWMTGSASPSAGRAKRRRRPEGAGVAIASALSSAGSSTVMAIARTLLAEDCKFAVRTRSPSASRPCERRDP